jgi:HAE1 family hydrophobic/amphiphilic exporter-1
VARWLDRFNAWFDRTADRYRGVIAWSLDHRKTVMTVAVLAFFAGLVVFGLLQSEFLPDCDQSEFRVAFVSSPDASLTETEGRLRAVLAVLDGVPEVERTYATIGAGDEGTVRDGSVFVKLVEKGERRRSQKEIERSVREMLLGVPGILSSVMPAASMGPDKPLQVGLRGEDLERLKAYAAELKTALYDVPGIVDLESSLETETPEYRLMVDQERAADAGLNTGRIVESLSALVGGQAVTTYEESDGDAVPVRVRLPEPLRADISQVEALRLSAGDGGEPTALVPLGDLMRHDVRASASQIIRRDLAREVVVSANLQGVPLGTAAKSARDAAAKLDLAPGYSVVLSGDTEIMEESFAYMAEALILAIIMVYLILAAQFESFVDPLAIMLSLPLAIVGMAVMLLITGDHVSIISLIGLIMLMGLVTKNAILLVDYTKTLRRRGLDRRAALIEAGRTRLRPIMMTTLAMIFGMLPTALAIGSGAEMRAPMGRGVIGGLITSTMLTLVVVPVMYSLLDDFVMRRRRRKAVAAEHETVGAPGGALVGGFVAALAVVSLVAPPAAAQAKEAAQASAPTRASQARSPEPAFESADTLVLTLADALKMAIDQNRDLKSAEEYRNWVQGRYVEERAAAFPRLTLEGSAVRQRDESQQAFFGGIFPAQQDVWTAQAGVTQALFTWGQISAAIHGAREAIREAEHRTNTARQEVVFEVTQAFYDVLLSREVTDIAVQNLVQKERHLDEARRKYAEGTATDYDVLAAEVAVDNSRPEVIRAANALDTARDRLRFLLAVETGEVDAVGVLSPADPLAPPPDYDAALATALEQRPDLAAVGHRMAVSRDVIKIYGAGDKPRIDLAAGYGWRSYDLEGMKADGDFWSVGLNLSFPIFDGMRTRGKVAQARSDFRVAENDEAALRDRIALDVRNALHEVVVSREIESAVEGTVSQADRLLAMAEAGYELGAKTRLEVEDAALNLMAARVDLARARRDRLVAEAGLKKVQGILAP